MTAQAVTIADFLLARIAEDAEDARPKTVVISGGFPAPEVPNCIGSGTGDCPEQWKITGEGKDWWKMPEVEAQIRAHEWSHANARQRRVLAECEAKRRIVKDADEFCAEYETWASLDDTDPHANSRAHYWRETILRNLALPYADHPDFRPEWRA